MSEVYGTVVLAVFLTLTAAFTVFATTFIDWEYCGCVWVLPYAPGGWNWCPFSRRKFERQIPANILQVVVRHGSLRVIRTVRGGSEGSRVPTFLRSVVTVAS